MKTIKDAVIELSGKFPDSSGKCAFLYKSFTGLLYAGDGSSGDGIVCTRSEFESTARKMGYINGYRYGVEYPTNGKRPDLPDDCLIELKSGYADFFDVRGVFSTLCIQGFFDGIVAISIRVIDQRYKPAEPEKAEPAPAKTWFEAGELPPVGAECEYLGCAKKWDKCKIVFTSEYVVVIEGEAALNELVQVAFNFGDWPKFRPIRTEREKAIDAADAVIRKTSSAVDDVALNALYDAGLLRLPEQK